MRGRASASVPAVVPCCRCFFLRASVAGQASPGGSKSIEWLPVGSDVLASSGGRESLGVSDFWLGVLLFHRAALAAAVLEGFLEPGGRPPGMGLRRKCA